MIYPNNTAHWYYPNGDQAYDKTLRDARKEILYPSVTTILRVLGKPELDAWKQRELLSVAASTTRQPDQTDDAYARTVADLYAEKQGVSVKRGSAIHEELEALVSGTRHVPASKGATFAHGVLEEHNMAQPIAEESFATCLNGKGYGGRIDLQCRLDGSQAIVDYKTQTIKMTAKGVPKPTIYDEMGMQLAAYRAGKESDARCYNLIIGTNVDYTYLHIWDEDELDRCLDMFLCCLDLFYYLKRLK